MQTDLKIKATDNSEVNAYIISVYGVEDTTRFKLHLTLEEFYTVKRVVDGCNTASAEDTQPSMNIYKKEYK